MGEVFDLELPKGAVAQVINSDPKGRHLLLYVQMDATKSKFLLGHDERHWFAAAIPEDAPVGTVAQAKRALQPVAVVARSERLKKKDSERRHNEAYIRQGEWFFVPDPLLKVPDFAIHKNEPLTRGQGKPHMAQYVFRRGGDTVYMRGGITLNRAEWEALDEKVRKAAWTTGIRDAEVYAKGLIRHPDHATIELLGWHQVFPNTEARARAMFRQLAFID